MFDLLITPALQTLKFVSAFQGVFRCGSVYGYAQVFASVVVWELTWGAYVPREGDINNMQYSIAGLLPRSSCQK